MSLKLTPEEHILLLCSKLQLSKDELLVINDFISQISDWPAFSKKIFQNGLAPFVYSNFKKLPNSEKIPAFLLANLKKEYINILFKNTLKIKDFSAIAKQLNENNIDFVPLKGLILIKYIYEDCGLRSMSDIDILVKEKDIETCKNIFLNSKWEIYDDPIESNFIAEVSETHHPYTFVLGKTKVELHKSLHPSLYSYQININDYWGRSSKIDFYGNSAYHFYLMDFIQHLCIHLHKHLIDEKSITLKHFCDISEVITKYQTEINWEQLLERSIQYNCVNEIREILSICKAYFETPIESTVIEKFKGNSLIDCQYLFVNYLRNNHEEIEVYLSKINFKHKFEKFQSIDGNGKKIRFLFHLFFPSKEFMMRNYSIKNKSSLPFYYLKRVFVDSLKGFKKSK